ncbi:MAG: S-layer protein [Nostoc sp.]|uniref:S-layer protein n=1 Tax=unclassified Nostoc TaxID=2593658 RepID=UPI002AD4DEA4|nr:S-layer protein [Nostoc sp. DedQUE03]MDZ7975734.1 S-layer protein [Nostoc sp. DedQUE03]MDZ8048437.1 S-layer protein [Nostoc sp. DedQUE02]
MKYKILATLVVLATTSFVTPAKSQEPVTEAPATSNQVVNACVQNLAQTLPNPFTDVPSDHWAFKAVMTMHYCGAFRQATPPTILKKLQPTQRQQQPQQEQLFEK